MRVIAGDKKGRRLTAPSGNGTRPTSDRVKEAMFSMIGPYFDGGTVLDPFAGSGALGIEALSRGASYAVFVDKHSTDVVTANLQALELAGQATVVRGAWPHAFARIKGLGFAYDLVFLDPPYRLDVYADIMGWLASEALLARDATIVAEFARAHDPVHLSGFEASREHVYGETKVCVYRYESEGR